MYDREKWIKGRIKKTGETKELRKEPDWTLFSDFYYDPKEEIYYQDCEIEIVRGINPIGIKLSQKETVSYESFCRRHSHDELHRKMPMKHSLILTGTGLGWTMEARCNVCGEIEDITDIDNW